MLEDDNSSGVGEQVKEEKQRRLKVDGGAGHLVCDLDDGHVKNWSDPIMIN